MTATEPTLALQTAIRARLVASAAVTELVHADAIFDRHARPEIGPAVNDAQWQLPPSCIVIGEGHAVYADRYRTFYDRAVADLHIWREEPGLIGSKVIADAIRDALPCGPWLMPGFHAPYVAITGARFMRDPNKRHSHGVVTVEALLRKAAA